MKTISKTKSSEQRSTRALILEQYPALEPYIEDFMPKKSDLVVCKCKDYIQMIMDPNGELIFFQCRSGPFIPTLRFLHRCERARTHCAAVESAGSPPPAPRLVGSSRCPPSLHTRALQIRDTACAQIPTYCQSIGWTAVL